MKRINFKPLLFLVFTLFSLFLEAQQNQSDEETGPYTTCNPEGQNATRTSDDLPNPVNVGTIDDRSCYANYKESTIDGVKWGIYNITDGSNHLGTSLQPRIERSLPRSRTTGVGSYALFTGTVRVIEVGDASGTASDGTYIMQSKGKHTGGGGPSDPAICLYLVKPVLGTNAQGEQVQVSFKLYREQINFRGGSGDDGRDIVYLTDLEKNVPIDIKLEVGFRKDPTNPSKRIHYSDAVIGGKTFNWNIPEPERGSESGIRYGAYRVKGGRAQIRWANTKYKREEVEYNPNADTGFFRLRNVATGKFLTDAGVTSGLVTMSDSGNGDDKNWTFVESGNFINIDSKTFGILRGPGANFAGGAYAVVSTGKAAPATDSDKVWTSHYNKTEDIYRFESGDSDRFLYHEESGGVTHIPAPDTDDRSKWQAIPESQVLSVSEIKLNPSAMTIYPNPAKNRFTMNFKGIHNVERVEIYNILGQNVFQAAPKRSVLEIESSDFETGIYLVKAFSKDNKVTSRKLVIK